MLQMKKLFFILSLLFILTACEGEQNPVPEPVPVLTAQDSIKVYEGTFIFAGNAAVLKGNQFVYQVKMDSTSNDLKRNLENYRNENGQTIPVTVKGKVTENKIPVGYSQIIEIKEVIDIKGEKKTEVIEEKD